MLRNRPCAMKSIYKSQGLAINGAPPAFAEQLHVGRPNIGNHEAFIKHVNTIFDNR